MARKPAALARELLRNFPKGRRSAKRRRARKPAGRRARRAAGAAGAAGADAAGSNGRGADAAGRGTVELEEAELDGGDELDGLELDDRDGSRKRVG